MVRNMPEKELLKLIQELIKIDKNIRLSVEALKDEMQKHHYINSDKEMYYIS